MQCKLCLPRETKLAAYKISTLTLRKHVEEWKTVQIQLQNENFQIYGVTQKVSEQCEDNPYGFNGVVVYDDGTYSMTPGFIPDMTGYNQYLTRRGNGFIAGVINADHRNNARASRQMLPGNVAVTVSAISTPVNTRHQPGGRHLDPPFTDGYVLQHIYGRGGNRSQLWDRDEQHEEGERNLRLKEKKKKAGRKRERSHHAGH